MDGSYDFIRHRVMLFTCSAVVAAAMMASYNRGKRCPMRRGAVTDGLYPTSAAAVAASHAVVDVRTLIDLWKEQPRDGSALSIALRCPRCDTTVR